MNDDPRDDASERLYQGRVQVEHLLERRRFDQAADLLGELLAQFPDDVELRCQGGELAYLRDELDEAKARLTEVLTSAPKHAEARRLLAWTLYERREFAESERVTLDLLADYPSDSYYLAMYAQLMLTTGHLEKAERLAQEAVRVEPDQQLALLILAVAKFVRSPSDPQAQDSLARLVSRYPQSTATINTVMALLVTERRYREALPLAQELLRAEPDDQDWVDQVVWLKTMTHWSMLPLWPMTRFGWLGSGVVWVAWAVLSRVIVPHTPLAPWADEIFMLLIVYVAYTYLWPGQLQSLIEGD